MLSEDLVHDIEQNALGGSRTLINQLRELQTSLNAMTSISVQCVRTYRLAVENVSQSSAESVVALNALIDKCSTLVSELKTMSDLADQMFVINHHLTLIFFLFFALSIGLFISSSSRFTLRADFSNHSESF